jgi:hypothetical protein
MLSLAVISAFLMGNSVNYYILKNMFEFFYYEENINLKIGSHIYDLYFNVSNLFIF